MSEQNKKQKNFFDSAWDFLASVRLAIINFFLISSTSIVGTVIEQNSSYQKNIEVLTKLIGGSYAPKAYSLLEAMGFMDMYRSWWFMALLGLFSINLIICSIDRFPPIWRLVKEKLKPLKEEQYRAFSITNEFMLTGKHEGNLDKIVSELSRMGFKKPETHQDGDTWQAFSQKHATSRLGVYITHVSIIVIMIGALSGVFFGFKGFLNLPEGSIYAMAFSSKQIPQQLMAERNMIIDTVESTLGDLNKASASLNVTVDKLKSRMRTLGIEPLGFRIACEDFEVSFYDQSDTPKDYASKLSIYEGDKKVLEKDIEVNDPLRYKGFTFYQSSYGMMDNTSNVYFQLAIRSGSIREDHEFQIGKTFTIPGTKMEISLLEFSPALASDASGRTYSYSEMMNNPALKINIKDGTTEYTRWVLKRYPSTWIINSDVSVELTDIWGAQYTGLQVRRDPGVWIVYLGCLIMGIGLYMAFFTCHRRIWVMATNSKGSTRVLVAASTHKNKEVFKLKISEMVTRLTEGGN